MKYLLPNLFNCVEYVCEDICIVWHNAAMHWDVEFHADFVVEYHELPEDVQDELHVLVQVLELLGPQMKRPRVDTLNGSKHKT